jgi:hypothetical protein
MEMTENSRLIVVPAQAGFDLVEPCRNERGTVDELVFLPIVAWAIELFFRKRGDGTGEDFAGSIAHSVTIEAPSDPLREVIRTLTGKFIFCEHTLVDDEAAAIAEFNRLFAEARELGAKPTTRALPMADDCDSACGRGRGTLVRIA